MVTTRINTYTGVDASGNAFGFSPPPTLSLAPSLMKARYIFGGTRALSLKNILNSSNSLSIIGTEPSNWVNSAYGALNGPTFYLDTGLLGATSASFIIVARSGAAFAASASQAVLMGGMGFTAAPFTVNNMGQRLVLTGTTGPTNAKVVAQSETGTIGTVSPPVSSSLTTNTASDATAISNVQNFHIYAATYNNGVGLSVYDLTDGTTAFTAAAGVSAPNPQITIKIGSFGSASTSAGAIDVAMVDIWNGALTTGDLTGVYYPSVKNFMAARGITGL